MFLHDKKHIAIAVGFVALAGLAIAGWTRQEAQPATQQPVAAAPAPVPYNASAPAVAEQDYGPGLSTDGYYASIGQPVYVRQAEPPPPAVNAQVSAQYVGGPGPYESRREYRRRHHRSLAKSIAIVAGSAGAGAAIGAITGGGPGAAIGAIAGGTGGFIYDRSTHNH